MELLREKVDTKIAVLASLRRCSDADDLARAALEDQEIANADVMARDGDGVGNHGASVVAHGFVDFTAAMGISDVANNYALTLDFLEAVMTAAVDGVDDAIRGALNTTADAVVVAVVVVISHIRSSLAVDCLPSSLLYSDLFAWMARRINCCPSFFYPNFGARVVVVTVTRRVNGRAGGLFDVDLGPPLRTTEARIGVSLFEPAGGLSHEWPCGLAVPPFSLVKDRFVLSTRTTNYASFTVVDSLLGESLVLDVELGVDVPLIRLSVAGRKVSFSSWLSRRDEKINESVAWSTNATRKDGSRQTQRGN